MAKSTRQRIIEAVTGQTEPEAIDHYAVPPTPDAKSIEEADRLIEQYQAKVETWNQEIIDAHSNGDHEAGDALRPKLTVLRRDLDSLIRKKGILERA